MPEYIDTFNRWLVGVSGDKVVIGNPPVRGEPLQKDDALKLAAYLVATADPGGKRWAKVLQAVKES